MSDNLDELDQMEFTEENEWDGHPLTEIAMPVAEILRRDVPRPTAPIFEKYDKTCYWETPFHPGHKSIKSCAMGLHPRSSSGYPIHYEAFDSGEASQAAVDEFMNWFDHQTNPEFILDQIWPK